MNDTTDNATLEKTTPLLDMPTFLEAQRHERYRAFVVHGSPTQGKTAFARKLVELLGGAYVDVLETVAGSRELSERVDTLSPNFLKEIALERAKQGANLVMLDEFDFLLPIWGSEQSRLFEIVRKLSVTETQAVVGFVMQTTPVLESLTLQNSAGQSRILRLDEIRGLK